jgi:hypothetical protein
MQTRPGYNVALQSCIQGPGSQPPPSWWQLSDPNSAKNNAPSRPNKKGNHERSRRDFTIARICAVKKIATSPLFDRLHETYLDLESKLMQEWNRLYSEGKGTLRASHHGCKLSCGSYERKPPVGLPSDYYHFRETCARDGLTGSRMEHWAR